MHCVRISVTAPRWRDFVETAERSTPFHHPAWSELMASCYGYEAFVLAVLGENGQITAGLPVLEVDSWLTGRRWIALAFSDHCSPLHADSETERRLLDELVWRAEARGISKLEVRWRLNGDRPFVPSSEGVLHLMPLAADVDSVVGRFHRMHRRNTSAAKKRGVTLEQGEDIDMVRQFYRLHLETRKRQGVPVQPWRFFRLLQETVLSKGLGFVLLARVDGECAAGAVFLHYRDVLIYKYGASSKIGQKARANNLIFDQAIRWGCQQNYEVFDMGKTATGNTGLRQFKSRWGAAEHPLEYSTYWKRVPGAKESRSGHIAERLIKASPSIVCRMAGELFYGHFA